MVWLPDHEKSLMICLAVSRQYRHVTDRQTDSRTDVLRQQSALHSATLLALT